MNLTTLPGSEHKEPHNNDEAKYRNDKSLEEQIEEIAADLRSNGKYISFFKDYSKLSVENFIDYYSRHKYNLLKYGEIYIKREENEFLEGKNRAEKRLWEIQQKKLFNIQCRWRAGLIEINEIRVCADFEYWSKNIENCSFLEPISEDDFNLYYDYILSDFFQDVDWMLSWQNYTQIKEEYYKENGMVPEWYLFFDDRRNTASLLELPDLRGEQEKFYLELWEQNQTGRYIQSDILNSKKDLKPNLIYFDQEIIENFIKNFESPKLLEYYRAYRRTALNEEDLELETAIEYLKKADETVEIEGGPDWRNAVIKASKLYKKRKIAIQHRQAYQNYLYREQYKIAHERYADDIEIEWRKEMSLKTIIKINEARIMNGETPLFDI